MNHHQIPLMPAHVNPAFVRTMYNPNDTRLFAPWGFGFRPWGFGWGFRPWGFGFGFPGFGFPFFGFPFFV
jgi:hypothetical protein